MKLTQQQLLDLVKAAGVQAVEVVDDEAQSEYNIDAILAEIDSQRVHVIKPKIVNEITKDLQGRVSGTLKSELARKTGIVRNLLNDLNDEEAITLALQHREDKYSTDSKTMRENLDKMTAAHAAEKEEIETKYKAEIQAAKDRYIQRDIQDGIVKKLEKTALPDTADRKVVANTLKNILSQNIDFGYDEEKGEIIPYAKGTLNPALNLAGSNVFDWNERIEHALAPLGLIRKDMRDSDPEALKKLGTQYSQQSPGQFTSNDMKAYNEQRVAMMEKIG